MKYTENLYVYVDESSRPKPRRGGIGIKFVFPSGVKKEVVFPGYKGGVVGEMAIGACIIALQEALKLEEVKNREIEGITIYSDSNYVVRHYKLVLFRTWADREWRKTDGSPVLNVSLWKDLGRIINRFYRNFRIKVVIEKVPGHSGIEGNEAADRLAKKSADIPFNKSTRKFMVRRKKTKEKTKPGAISAKGQKIKIRVVDILYFPEQKGFRLRCEVISKNSEYFGKISFLFSKTDLRPGHEYLVSLKKNQNYPQISKVLEKIR